jgi:hypothetical protein
LVTATIGSKCGKLFIRTEIIWSLPMSNYLYQNWFKERLACWVHFNANRLVTIQSCGRTMWRNCPSHTIHLGTPQGLQLSLYSYSHRYCKPRATSKLNCQYHDISPIWNLSTIRWQVEACGLFLLLELHDHLLWWCSRLVHLDERSHISREKQMYGMMWQV